MLQQISRALLGHHAACVPIIHCEEPPMREFTPQLREAVVEIFHVGSPTLHAGQGIGKSPGGTSLLHMLIQNRPLQVGARDDPFFLSPLLAFTHLPCTSPPPPFKKGGDPFFGLLHQLPYKSGHFHASLPGCSHGVFFSPIVWILSQPPPCAVAHWLWCSGPYSIISQETAPSSILKRSNPEQLISSPVSLAIAVCFVEVRSICDYSYSFQIEPLLTPISSIYQWYSLSLQLSHHLSRYFPDLRPIGWAISVHQS